MNGGSSLNTKLPVFDGKNWNRWKIQMRVLFDAQDVLDLVSEGYVQLQQMLLKNRDLQKELRGRGTRKLCSISISVWMKMCLRRLLIRRRRKGHGIY